MMWQSPYNPNVAKYVLHSRRVLAGLQKVAQKALEEVSELEGMAQLNISSIETADMAQTEGIGEDTLGKGTAENNVIDEVGVGRFRRNWEARPSALNHRGYYGSYAKRRPVQKRVKEVVKKTLVQCAGEREKRPPCLE